MRLKIKDRLICLVMSVVMVLCCTPLSLETYAVTGSSQSGVVDDGGSDITAGQDAEDDYDESQYDDSQNNDKNSNKNSDKNSNKNSDKNSNKNSDKETSSSDEKKSEDTKNDTDEEDSDSDTDSDDKDKSSDEEEKEKADDFIISGLAEDEDPDSYPELTGTSAVLINMDTGEVIYGKNKDEMRYPASTTKIMTAMIVLENMKLSDVCTVSAEAAEAEGSILEVKEGEELTVEQLLYALMLQSANDAAVVLAESCAGSVEKFVDLMNEKAESLGATNTNFVTPNGLPDDLHYTTAADMARIAQAAMKIDAFREIVKTVEYTIPETNECSKERTVKNRNKLLFSDTEVEIDGESREIQYEGAIGIKTGHTEDAGYCLVSAAERDDMTLLAVVFESDENNIFSDSIKLLDYGFDNFELHDLGMKAGKSVGEITISGGMPSKVDVTVKKDVCVMDSGKNDKDYNMSIKGEKLEAPVKKGTYAGRLIVSEDDREVASFDLYTMSDVEEFTIGKALKRNILPIIGKILVILLVIAAVGGAAYMLLVTYIRRKDDKKKAARMHDREEREREYRERSKKSNIDRLYEEAKRKYGSTDYSSRYSDRYDDGYDGGYSSRENDSRYGSGRYHGGYSDDYSGDYSDDYSGNYSDDYSGDYPRYRYYDDNYDSDEYYDDYSDDEYSDEYYDDDSGINYGDTYTEEYEKGLFRRGKSDWYD